MTQQLPPLNSLRVFEATVRLGNYRLVAEELHVTSSAVSHSVLTLEAWLGLKLFERGSRGLVPTAAANAFLPSVSRALALISDATDQIAGARTDGHLSLSAEPTFANRWLVPRLPRFAESYPDISISIDTSSPESASLADGVDLQIRYSHKPPAGVGRTKLTRDAEPAADDEEAIALLELVERDDAAVLYEEANLAVLARLKQTARDRYEALHVTWRKRRVPGLREVDKAVDRQIKQAAEGGGAGAAAVAKRFVAAARPNLIRWRGDWFDYVGSHYRDVEREAIRADLWAHHPYYQKKHIDELEDALRGVVLKDRDAAAPPCWLSDEEGDPPADELLSCRNGILHLPTLRFMPHTPRLFTRTAIAVDFDPQAPEPVEWLRFLDAAWGNDHEQVRLLQEIIGYLVSVDTSMQKFFMLLGPTRSGKGIITRTVTKLIGKRNVCSPTLDSLGTRFGLETALGKTLATISDMRLEQRTDRQNIVGNILRITGEDDVDVERKHIGGAWTGKLGIRFLISTNLPPALPDVSGALVGRLIAVKMTESFLGREDREMERRLERELPGILLWAAAGWRRLREQRDFTETRAGKELRERMRLLASPLQAFVEDACRIVPDGRVRKEDLWHAYSTWSFDKGLAPAYSSPQYFHRDLEAATQYRISEHRPRTGRVGPDGQRAQELWWYGIALKDGS